MKYPLAFSHPYPHKLYSQLHLLRRQLAIMREKLQSVEEENTRLRYIEEENAKLRIENADLKARLNLNSSNSSMPPSTDRKPNSRSSSGTDATPSPKSLRTKSGKSPGAQKGHKGHGFSLPRREPDRTIHCVPSECSGCPHAAECSKSQQKIDTRYVLDLIIETLLLKYIAYSRKCPIRAGQELTGTFPQGVSHTKQYGDNFWTFAVALYLYFNCAYEKIHDFLSQITGSTTSAGWAWNKVKTLAESMTAEEAIKKIKGLLLKEPSVVCDETGIRAESSNVWVHTVSTPKLTYQSASRKRGAQGMIEADFLPHYSGIVTHDCWSPYWNDVLKSFDKDGNIVGEFKHSLCNQHLIRELLWVYENGHETCDHNQNWAIELAALLIVFKDIRDEAISKGEKYLSNGTIENCYEVFMDYVNEGFVNNPYTKEKKDSKIHKKIIALLNRLSKRINEFLKFLEDFDVPFTSNQAELDLRGFKPRMSVSGCFRTFEGCKRFTMLKSIMDSAHKLGVSWKDAILGLIKQENLEKILPYDVVT